MTLSKLLSGLAVLAFVLGANAAFSQTGCTAASACNFDPVAVTDDGTCCFTNCVTVDVTPDTFFGIDNSRWEIRNETGNIVAEGLSGISELCLSNACFTFHLFDDFGDGWGASIFSVTVNGEETLNTSWTTGTSTFFNIESSSCTESFGCTLPMAANYDPAAGVLTECLWPGCTDPTATNFNPNAGVDDGSCGTTTACPGGSIAGFPGILQVGFTGSLSPENWTTLSEGNGNVQHDEFNMLLTSSDGSSASGSLLTQRTITAPKTGTYYFSWDYFSTDAGAQYEIGYYINGVRFDLSSPAGSLTQAGTNTIEVNAGDVLGFGIESTDDFGGPAYLLISSFGSPTNCGCIAATACNYDPTVDDGGPSECNWDCYSCFGAPAEFACNAGPLGTFAQNTSINNIYFDLIGTFDYLSLEELLLFIDSEVFVPPCIDFFAFGCDCWNELFASSAYQQVLPDAGYFNDDQLICSDHQIMGMHGGSNSSLTAVFSCFNIPAEFAAYPGQNTTIEVVVPSGIPTFRLVGNGVPGNVINIHKSPSTTYSQYFFGGATVNVIDDGPICGCTNDLACNYDPAAELDDFSCQLPDGCDDPASLNYLPGALCSGNCIYLNDCCQQVDGTGTRVLGFNGDYQLSSWSTATEGGDGTVVYSENQIVITGNNNGSGLETTTSATITAAQSGLYSFDWEYATADDGEIFDPGVYSNGSWLPLTLTAGDLNQAGRFTFQANAGDVIGFGVNSVDGTEGAATLKISKFLHPGTIECTPGCTSPLACNYNPASTFDNGSCEYSSCAGCTYPDADNYNPTASIDDGSCVGPDGLCPADITGDGEILTDDLLIVLGAFGSSCP